MRKILGLLLAMTVALSVAGCGDDGDSDTGARGKVVIGSAGFTEIQLMAEMYAAVLEDHGYDTEIKVVQNRELYEPALENGEIDVVPDYLATMAEFLNRAVNGPEAPPIATNDAVETKTAMEGVATERGLTVLDPAKAVNQNAFVVTKAFADENDLKTLSDLGNSGLPVVLAATEECPERPFCQIGLRDVYSVEVSKVLPTGFGTVQTKDAVRDGTAQLGLVGTTDATLASFGLVILTDDRGLQLADNLVPIVGKKYADDTVLSGVLDELSAVLTTKDLAALNERVDGQREKPADVARDYLESKDLIDN